MGVELRVSYDIYLVYIILIAPSFGLAFCIQKSTETNSASELDNTVLSRGQSHQRKRVENSETATRVSVTYLKKNAYTLAFTAPTTTHITTWPFS